MATADREPPGPDDRPAPRTPRRARSHEPSGGRWTSAAVVLGASALALALWSYADQFVPSAAAASTRLIATNLAVPVVIGVLGWLLARYAVRRVLPRTPAGYVGTLVGSLVLLLTLGPGVSRLAWVAVALLVVVCASVLGATGRTVLRPGGRRARPLVALVVTVGVVGGAATWLVLPTGGPPTPLPGEDSIAEQVEDLSRPGAYAVQTLTYGSGDDRLRSEYRDVAFRTPTVDLSEVVTGWSDGAGAMRTAQWGFDATAFPLNARVWYPRGPGPFPLVLLLHGNKSSVEFSEGGLGYLAEALASRGVIAASIDEDFLNTSLLDSSGGIGGAELARPLLLLEHLAAFRDHADDLGPLTGRVDLSRIALIGHSRGGEAVAVAAALDQESQVPDHPDVALPHGFGITSVIALAPSDGQYEPGGEGVQLSGVDYLVVQGSHDVDVSSFVGLDQYERTALGPGDIKAALYIGGADHSQFNTSWGRRDIGNGLPQLFINTGALISAHDQQQIATAWVAAFLETTLLDVDRRALLRDHRAGADWLPATRYVSQYADGDTVALLTAREDDDRATGAQPGSTVTVDGAASWEEAPLALRSGPGVDRTLVVHGDGRPVTATVTLQEPVGLPADGAVTVDAELGGGDRSLPVTLVVSDVAGRTVTVPAAAEAPPPIPGNALRAAWMRSGSLTEPVLQTIRVPAADIASAGDIDVTSLVSIGVEIDPGNGVCLLDDLGLTTG